jgi:hypothetical protein
MPESPRTGSSHRSDRWAITPRSLVIGALSALSVALILPYTINVIHGSRIGLSSCTPAAFILFFVVLLTVQVLLTLLKRNWHLRPGELVVIFIMMALATHIGTRGVSGKLVVGVTGGTFYTTPENNWAELIDPVLAEWLVLSDTQAVRDLYYGGSVDRIPWHLWLPVLLRWFVLFIAYHLMLLSALVILRRQWVEKERLAFPMAQVPLAMVQDNGSPHSIIKPFFKNPVMWAGFLFCFLINSTNILHNYFPWIPAFMGQAEFMIFREQIQLTFRINFLMLGFAYFINTGVAFSIWFFYLVKLAQHGIFITLGIDPAQNLAPVSGSIFGHQMMGALTVLVLFGLWTARSHLKEVLRKAWNKDAPVDDSREIMSYRAAVLCFLGGAAFVFVWLWQSGFPAWIAPIFIFATLVIMIGLARVIAETGIPTITPAMGPATFVMSGIGATALGMQGVVAAGYTLVWASGFLTFVTAPMVNALRLGSEITRHRRALVIAIGLAVAIAIAAATWFWIYLGYKHGGINLNSRYYQVYSQSAPRFAEAGLNSATGPNLVGWMWSGIGAAIMIGLMIARHTFAWWPFHPVGFAISTSWVLTATWMSTFFAWLIKLAVLKYGGPALYERTKPFFMGIILGQFVAAGFWLLVDAFTGVRYNHIRVY